MPDTHQNHSPQSLPSTTEQGRERITKGSWVKDSERSCIKYHQVQNRLKIRKSTELITNKIRIMRSKINFKSYLLPIRPSFWGSIFSPHSGAGRQRMWFMVSPSNIIPACAQEEKSFPSSSIKDMEDNTPLISPMWTHPKGDSSPQTCSDLGRFFSQDPVLQGQPAPNWTPHRVTSPDNKSAPVWAQLLEASHRSYPCIHPTTKSWPCKPKEKLKRQSAHVAV